MKSLLARFDVWLKLVFERRYGPMETWALTRYLIRRRQRIDRDGPLRAWIWFSTPLWQIRRLARLSCQAVFWRIDRGLRVVFEFFFGPMETWGLTKWLIARNERKYGPDPSVGRGRGRSSGSF